MVTIVLRLDPNRLDNPDTDIRYTLPDLIVERSAGVIRNDGYDYVGDVPYLIMYLRASDLETALECVVNVIENVRVLNNDLRPATVVAVEREHRHRTIVYPPGFVESFLP